MTSAPKKQVNLELVGINGNAFAVLGAFIKAARERGWTQNEIDPVWKEATSGDYDHLLQTVMQHTK